MLASFDGNTFERETLNRNALTDLRVSCFYLHSLYFLLSCCFFLFAVGQSFIAGTSKYVGAGVIMGLRPFVSVAMATLPVDL